MNEQTLTQYKEMKRKHPAVIVLFRVGDFYETFGEDAVKVSEILQITLTRRRNGKAGSIELAGFPQHALDTYLPKLIRAGQRVAICESIENPKPTKRLVKRDISQSVLPPEQTRLINGIAIGKSDVLNTEEYHNITISQTLLRCSPN